MTRTTSDRTASLALAGLAVIGLSLAVLIERPSPVERPLASAADGQQAYGASALLWPGAFHPSGTPSAASFVARGKRYVADVRSDGFVVAEPRARSSGVALRFVGARADLNALASDSILQSIRLLTAGAAPLEPMRLHRRITFRDVYPGIDSVYRVEPGSGDLEFDFAIAPGADPRVIRLAPAPGTRLQHEPATGNLFASNEELRYRLNPPVAYQMIDGARVDVSARFILAANGVSFEVGAYDRSHELIIDPLVARHSTFVGSDTDAMYDTVNAVAVDGAGNVYLAGRTQMDLQIPIERGFPTSPGSLYVANPAAPGNGCQFQCGYILKLDQNQQVVYGALIFGLNIQALAVDSAGAAYATGHTLSSTQFPATPGAFSNDPTGQTFAIKLNAAGSALEYAALFVGVIGRAIAVDALGNAFVAGEVGWPNLPTTPGAIKPAYQPTGDLVNTDGFLLKINAAGSALVYGTYLGGTGHDTVYGLTLDASGRAVVAGETQSTDFVGFAGDNRGLRDAFVMRVSEDGGSIVDGRYLGGSASEHAAAVARDGQGGFLVSGATQSSDFPITSGVVQTRLLGTRNGFLVRLDADFDVRYSTYFGGSFIDGLLAVTADAEGRAYAAGPTFSADLLTTPDGLQDASAAYSTSQLAGAGTSFYAFAANELREAFFIVLSPDGSRLEYGTYLGGFYTIDRGWSALTFGSSVARAADGSIYVGGSTSTESFPTTGAGLRSDMGGQADGFLVRFVQQTFGVSSPTLLPPAPIGTGYSYQLQAAGGAPPYAWSVAGFTLPDGLTLSATGLISGTPHTTQRESYGYQFTVEVTDQAGRTAHKSLFINPVYTGNPACTPNRCVLSVTRGQAFIFDLPFPSRAVAPLTLSVDGLLPPGIDISTSDGTFGGTPTDSGVYDFTLGVTDALGVGHEMQWQVRVDSPLPPPPSPPPAPPPDPDPPSSSGGGGGGATTPGELLAILALVALRIRRRRPHLQ